MLAVGACMLRKQRLRRAHDELGESSAAARAAEEARGARVAEERARAVQAVLESAYQEKHGEIENWRALTVAAEAAKDAAEGREDPPDRAAQAVAGLHHVIHLHLVSRDMQCGGTVAYRQWSAKAVSVLHS